MKSSPDDGCTKEGEGHTVNGTQEGIVVQTISQTAWVSLAYKISSHDESVVHII